MSGKPTEPQKQQRNWMAIAVAAAVAALLLAALVTARPANNASLVTNESFSDFLAQVQGGKVAHVTVNSTNTTLTATLKDHGRRISTTYSPDFQLTNRLEQEGVAFDVTTAKAPTSPIVWLILFGAIGAIVMLIMMNRSRQTAAKASAGSPGKMTEAGEGTVTFKDVAGCNEVVAELQEIREFLADPARFRKLGASIPKGVLLFGPPGTGKTLLARAVAGEANVPFFSISGSDFVEMYVGVGASRVRKLFEAAKAQAPCVIFIDEIDAVGRRRSGNAQGGQEERENTLNQLLVEIDGFAPNDNVIVIAASNRADILDPALTRPGRFDRQVIVDSPDRTGRRDILEVHSKGKPFAKDVDLGVVASQTAGFCGADLASLVNEAALLAARNDRTEIGNHDLDEAMMRVIAGPQKTRLLHDDEKRTIAAHEIGHAIVAHDLPETQPVHKVTIVSRGRALGLMVSLQEQDKMLQTRGELLAQMSVALGGRVAEEIMFDDVTTGASNDLEKVNEIAQAMVLLYGMSDQFALRSFMHQERLVVHSDELKNKIDAEIDALVAEAKLTTQTILLERRSELEKLTSVLIERETINREEFEQLMRGEELAPMLSESEDADRTHAELAISAALDAAGLVEGNRSGDESRDIADARSGARELRLVSDSESVESSETNTDGESAAA